MKNGNMANRHKLSYPVYCTTDRDGAVDLEYYICIVIQYHDLSTPSFASYLFLPVGRYAIPMFVFPAK